MAPAIGVPNTLANPALTPHATIRLRSSPLRRSAVPIAAPSEAPMWAHGPSFPAEPPQARVMSAATGLIGIVPSGIRPSCSCTAANTESFKPERWAR